MAITRNCEGADGSLTYECGDEAATLTLVNSSSITQTFQWTLNGAPQQAVDVGPNSSKTVAVPVNEDATVTVVVTGPGNFSKTMAITRNCTEAVPSAKVESQCKVPGGQLVITLKNEGDQEAKFIYAVNGGQTTPINVPANDKKTVSLTVSDGSYVVKVNELTTGFEVSETVNVNCEEPPSPACENITGRPTEHSIPAEGKDYNIVFHTSGSLTKIKLQDANGTVVGEITAAQGEYLPAEVTMKVHLLPDTAYFTFIAGPSSVYVPAGNACALTAPTDLPPDDEPVLILHVFLPVVTK